jgi:hypothetical protein
LPIAISARFGKTGFYTKGLTTVFANTLDLPLWVWHQLRSLPGMVTLRLRVV